MIFRHRRFFRVRRSHPPIVIVVLPAGSAFIENPKLVILGLLRHRERTGVGRERVLARPMFAGGRG